MQLYFNAYCLTEYTTAVIIIEQLTKAVQMSDKAYGTEYVPYALSEEYTLTNLAYSTEDILVPGSN